MSSDSAPLIFISYTRNDKGGVLPFFDGLRNKGYNVWMDHLLKGGQNWDFEIKRALNKAAIIVVFLSATSIVKRGYVQREIKYWHLISSRKS
jgi:TIR domain